MKISHWIIVASFIAPLFACSSSDSGGDGGAGGATAGSGGGTAGTGGSVVTGGTGGGTAGTGGSTAGTGGGTAGTGGATGGTGGGTSQCTLGGSDTTCNACFQTKCESQCVAVMGDPDILNCYAGCSDQTCVDGCDAQYPAGAATYATLVECMNAQCPTECGSTGSCIMQFNDATCQSCFENSCISECETYSALPSATDHFNCVLACEDAACETACDNQYPEAAAPFGAIFDCLGANCSDECGVSNTTSECGMVTSMQGCNDCFDANCFDQCKAVADHADTSAYLACYNACTDQACADGCDSQYAEISALFATFDECINTSCATECAAP